MRNNWLVSVTVIALIALTAGCAGNNDNTTTQKRYADDGYMGMSTANPGVPTSPGARTSYNNDIELVDQALQDMPHIRRKTVRINGGNMRVRLKVSRSLDEGQLASLREEAGARLSAMFPRYDVDVRISR